MQRAGRRLLPQRQQRQRAPCGRRAAAPSAAHVDVVERPDGQPGQRLDPRGADLRRRRPAALRQRRPGRRPRRAPARSRPRPIRCGSAATALRRVLPGTDRRGPHLQPRAEPGRDPDRHEHADRPSRAGHDPADCADGADRDRGRARPDQSDLDRVDRQRRRHRLPRGALPGRGLHRLRAGRHADRDDTLSDTGLAATTTYSYRVRATDAAGNLSAYSERASATTTLAPDTTPPTAPTGLGATAAQHHPDQPGLDRLDRQRRRHRLPGRALPGCGLHATSPRSARRPATTFNNTGLAAEHELPLSGCGRPMPPATSAPYSTIASATTRAAADTTRADRADRAHGNAVISTSQINLTWTAVDRQRRRHRLPRRALPGHELHQLRPDRHADRNDASATRAWRRTRSTATGCGRPTRPGNLSAYSTIVIGDDPGRPTRRAPTAPTGLTATAVEHQLRST